MLTHCFCRQRSMLDGTRDRVPKTEQLWNVLQGFGLSIPRHEEPFGVLSGWALQNQFKLKLAEIVAAAVEELAAGRALPDPVYRTGCVDVQTDIEILRPTYPRIFETS